MSRVRRNVVANFAGQIWTALIGIAFVPIYIRWMGIEAFGLVGVFLTVQAIASLFDLGLAGTLNRELARASGAQQAHSASLVRTLEVLYWPIGLALAAALAAAAPWIAGAWLHPVTLSASETTAAVRWMALAIACQWPTFLYAAGLNGLQRQVSANLLAATFATLRGAGVLVPLWIFGPSLKTFFVWMVVVAAVQTAAHARVLWRALPPGNAARFSWQRLRSIGRFSAGITGIGALGFFLLQADRLVLSRLLPLDRFGVYALAATVAVMFSKAAQPWFAAVYPRLSELYARHDPLALAQAYHGASQWVAVTVLPAAAVLALYAGPLLELWSRDAALATQAAPVFSVLIVGYALNGLMTMPYALQLAHGWTRLTLVSNSIAAVLIVPSIVWLNARFGMVGAAAAWPLLNAAYLLITIPLMHRKILKDEMNRWVLSDTAPGLAVNVLLALAAWALPPVPASAAGIARIGATYLVLLACTLMAAPRCRHSLATLLQARPA